MNQPFGQHPLAGTFNRLDPTQLLDAVESSGNRATGSFLALNSYENRVYQFDLEDGGRLVGKFYRPGRWTKEAILEEHAFLKELQEREVPVSAPITLQSGTTLEETLGIYFALFPSVGGRSPQELSDEQVGVLGRLLGRIHNVGNEKTAHHRVHLSPESYGRANLDFLLEHDVIPAEIRPHYEQTVEQLLKEITPLFTGVNMLRIHGDCHLGNLLWPVAGPTFLDFDDMVVGPAVQDIWMLTPSFDAEGQRQRRLLMEAYRMFRDFNEEELRLIEPLRALRYIHYTAWIGRRWEDPIFKKTFGHFGDLRYWQQETQDLREQLGRIMQNTYG